MLQMNVCFIADVHLTQRKQESNGPYSEDIHQLIFAVNACPTIMVSITHILYLGSHNASVCSRLSTQLRVRNTGHLVGCCACGVQCTLQIINQDIKDNSLYMCTCTIQ